MTDFTPFKVTVVALLSGILAAILILACASQAATPPVKTPNVNHICNMWAQTDNAQKYVMLNATKVEASCLARSLAKVCKATDGDGFTDYRVMDEVQQCMDRPNGLAHAQNEK